MNSQISTKKIASKKSQTKTTTSKFSQEFYTKFSDQSSSKRMEKDKGKEADNSSDVIFFMGMLSIILVMISTLFYIQYLLDVALSFYSQFLPII